MTAPFGRTKQGARKRLWWLGSALLYSSFLTHPALAETSDPRTTYGDIGILEMPTSRLAPDGTLSFSVGTLSNIQRYNLSFTMTPWLSADFRYSHIDGLFGFSNYYDRSFGFKMRLVEEGGYLPAIAVGSRDILGTGIYSSEYFVASKNVGPVDLSLGMGWGRLAQSQALPNPFASIFPSLKTRGSSVQTGGDVNFNQLFRGPKVGLFGGAVWHTPIDNLNFLLEYSSDRYDQESGDNVIKVRAPVNVGISYRAWDSVSLSAAWLYGNSFGLTATLDGNVSRPTSPIRLSTPLPPPVIRTQQEQSQALTGLLRPPSGFVQTAYSPLEQRELTASQILMSQGMGVRSANISGHTLIVDTALSDRSRVNALNQRCSSYAQLVSDIGVDSVAVADLSNGSKVVLCPVAASATNTPFVIDAAHATNDKRSATRKIRADLTAQSLATKALEISGGELWLYYENPKYFSQAEAAGRAARVLLADAPPEAEIFHVILVRQGMPLREFRYVRSSLERAVTDSATPSEMAGGVEVLLPPPRNPILAQELRGTYPKFDWGFAPSLREGLFNPDKPLAFQIVAVLYGALEIAPGLTLEGAAEANIYNDVDTSFPANSQLPHVRTDVLQYIKDGKNGIANLDLRYMRQILPGLYGEVRGGYLESMYAGVGAQLLWQPENSRFGLGGDIYDVRQRAFDRLFGLRPYDVVTGHISAYYQSPWYGLNFAVHAGRYLARDRGATFQVSRRFSTGVEVGAYATFTNVPFSVFGEGSFDKGIYISIPLEWGLPYHTRTQLGFNLASLTRDGGQRLAGDDSLFYEVQDVNSGEIARHRDELVQP